MNERICLLIALWDCPAIHEKHAACNRVMIAVPLSSPGLVKALCHASEVDITGPAGDGVLSLKLTESGR